MAPRLLQLGKLAPNEIIVRDRLRPVSEAKIEALIASFEETGVMMHPVLVAKEKRSKKFVLMAGMHRLEAAKRLEWAEVPVRAFAETTKEWQEIVELEENLTDPGMTPLDTAVFLAKRKRLYEAKYPDTRQGAKGRMAANGTQTEPSSVSSFAKVAGDIRGVSERQIRKAVRAGEVLTEQEVHALRGLADQVTLAELVHLSKIPDAAQRANIVTNRKLGTIGSIKEGINLWKSQGKAPISKSDQLYQRLSQAWQNAPKPVKRDFVAFYATDLRKLLEEMGDAE